MKKINLRKLVKEEIFNTLKELDGYDDDDITHPEKYGGSENIFYKNKKILDGSITDELISMLEYFNKYYSSPGIKRTKEFSSAIVILKYIKKNISRYQKIR